MDESQIILPDEMTHAMRDALGMPNFQCGPIARVFRDAGHDIPRTSEAEQAFVLFWALRLAIQHGGEWRAIADRELNQLRTVIAATIINGVEERRG